MTALAVSKNNVFEIGEPFESHGAPGVKFSGTDADFGPQAVHEAVSKARGAVHHDAAGIDGAQEGVGRATRIRDDGVRVV